MQKGECLGISTQGTACHVPSMSDTWGDNRITSPVSRRTADSPFLRNVPDYAEHAKHDTRRGSLGVQAWDLDLSSSSSLGSIGSLDHRSFSPLIRMSDLPFQRRSKLDLLECPA